MIDKIPYCHIVTLVYSAMTDKKMTVKNVNIIETLSLSVTMVEWFIDKYW